MKPTFGYQERAHTADWELEVWAPNLPCLLEQSARGMYALSGLRWMGRESQSRAINLHAVDAESLLVRFLTELLWLEQEEGIGIKDFFIEVDNMFSLHADLRGEAIAGVDKEIKAVTYHNLEVSKTSEGLHVNIVFDV
jgi:SHS2 domain-containing protein